MFVARHVCRIASRARRHLSRLLGIDANCTEGVAAIELGLILPVLVVAFIGTLDLGIGIYRKMQVQNAAQAGAAYALTHGFIPNAIKTATTGATSYTAVAATPDPVQFCGCASASGVSSATCGSTCAGGAQAGTYVTVSAQATYAPLIPYPMLQSSYLFTSQSTVRVQ
jgi:Flp pilus assembly protein TadG